MTHRILDSVKSIALSVGLRLATRGSKRLPEAAAPEPIVDNFLRQDLADEWMFDRDGSPVSMCAETYSRDLSRVSGALGSLRALLGDIAAHQPLADEPGVVATFAPVMSDELLFDGEPMAPHYGDMPLEDADLFAEDMPVRMSPRAEDGLSQVA